MNHLPAAPGSLDPSAYCQLSPLAAAPAAGRKNAATTDAPPMLAATQVRKSYNIGGEQRWVLDGVDFHARSGECVFLSGPSGSGKSTLLSILGCLLECDSGEITVDGHRIDRLSAARRTELRRRSIGFVFQRFQLIRGLSAEDNVAVPLALQGLKLAEARDRAAQLLNRVGLAGHRKHLPTAMSPGQCQRVALARAVITRPPLVLADEPTAALDGRSGIEVMELLQELVGSTGAATVVVTHDPRILKYADRVCEIENGQFK
ncbi:MAG: ABC transporter ATP-binding protein [Pirellulales bacterium]|nr:ABC transporter ATP-binding protein [Pirellulales bacterium]